MPPRIHVVTLAVADHERLLAFYRALGLESPVVGGTEYVADDDHPGAAVAMFNLEGGMILSLYCRSDLAKDAGIPCRWTRARRRPGSWTTASLARGPPSPRRRRRGGRTRSWCRQWR